MLLFNHGGALRLDVECLECELTDLGADDLGTSDLDEGAESSGLGAWQLCFVVPAKAGTHNHRTLLLVHMAAPAAGNSIQRWLWVPARASLGRDDQLLLATTHVECVFGFARVDGQLPPRH